MTETAVEALGIAETALGLVGDVVAPVDFIIKVVKFGLQHFHKRKDKGSIIKVAVGLEGRNEEQPRGTGGRLPDVRVYDDNGDFIGKNVHPHDVTPGTLGKITVEHLHQGVYTLFSANRNDICIAWVTTTWSDIHGGNKYAVSGDFGKACGASWYASSMYPSDQVDYQPDCFWIDGHGLRPHTGFQVRWPAYSGHKYNETDRDATKFCDDVTFDLRIEHDPRNIRIKPRPPDPEKRATPIQQRRSSWMGKDVVLSDTKSHSAKRLCESDTSVGPDFAHPEERLFCEMETKTLYDFCGDATEDCFDYESLSLLLAVNKFRPRSSTGRSYEFTRDWRVHNRTQLINMPPSI